MTYYSHLASSSFCSSVTDTWPLITDPGLPATDHRLPASDYWPRITDLRPLSSVLRHLSSGALSSSSYTSLLLGFKMNKIIFFCQRIIRISRIINICCDIAFEAKSISQQGLYFKSRTSCLPVKHSVLSNAGFSLQFPKSESNYRLKPVLP